MQPDDPLNDAALDRQLRRALAVDPSPEFVARVRTRVANEPARTPWRASWMFAIGAVAAIVVAAIVVQWANRGLSPAAGNPLLASRSIAPVEICGIPHPRCRWVACVPLPAPGGPSSTRFSSIDLSRVRDRRASYRERVNDIDRFTHQP